MCAEFSAKTFCYSHRTKQRSSDQPKNKQHHEHSKQEPPAEKVYYARRSQPPIPANTEVPTINTFEAVELDTSTTMKEAARNEQKSKIRPDPDTISIAIPFGDQTSTVQNKQEIIVRLEVYTN